MKFFLLFPSGLARQVLVDLDRPRPLLEQGTQYDFFEDVSTSYKLDFEHCLLFIVKTAGAEL
jgi:hypothetical protein